MRDEPRDAYGGPGTGATPLGTGGTEANQAGGLANRGRGFAGREATSVAHEAARNAYEDIFKMNQGMRTAARERERHR